MDEEPKKNGEKTGIRDEKGRFVEGNPGGPGHPLGQRNFATDFDEVVEELAKMNNISVSEARKILLKKAYMEAKGGNFNFYRDIIDRYYGKPKENVDINFPTPILHVLHHDSDKEDKPTD